MDMLPLRDQDTIDLDAPLPAPGNSPRDRYALGRVNPCYVLSGLCMLAGCLLISAAAHADPDRVAPVFGALAAVVTYELAVIGLVVWLVRRFGRPREVLPLLLIEALLLVDVPLLYNELFLARPGAGGVAAAAGLLFGLVKFGAVAHVLGVRIRPACWVVVSGGLAMAFGLPGVVHAAAPGGFVPIGLTYALWWVVGLLVAGAGVPGVWRAAAGDDDSALGAVWRRAVVGGGIASAAGHLLVVHYAFGAPLDPAHASPVLLGAAGFAVLRVQPGEATRAWARAAASLAAAGVAVSLLSPAWVVAQVSPIDAPVLSPMRWSLAAAAALLGLLALRAAQPGWLAGAVVLLVPMLAGPTPGVVLQRAGRLTGWVWRMLEGLLPRTVTQWGFVLIAAAFAMLISGTAWSRVTQRRRA